MRTKSHAGKGKGKVKGGDEKYQVMKCNLQDDWLFNARHISFTMPDF